MFFLKKEVVKKQNKILLNFQKLRLDKKLKNHHEKQKNGKTKTDFERKKTILKQRLKDKNREI